MAVNYTEYLKATLPARQQDLASRQNALVEKLRAQQQAAKNASAPVVSGSGGGGSSIDPATIQNFKTAGDKHLPTGARVSQNWGKSRIKYAAGRHTGMDFAGAHGSNIRSAANGVVVKVGREGAYGNVVKVRHPDGYTTLYGHLSGTNVKAGQRVKSGQAIGKMGNTGRSTGTHLHFEVRSRDSYGGDVNPYSWLKGR